MIAMAVIRTLKGIKILIENSKPVYALVSTTGRGKWGQTLDHYCVDVSYQAPFDSGGKETRSRSGRIEVTPIMP